jgi:hypothetical protein
MKRNVVLAVAVAATLSSFAVVGQQPAGSPYGEPGKGPAPNPENFEKVKAATLKSHQGRIRILQQTASCIQSAGDISQLRACDQKEREAQKQMRDQSVAEMESIRTQRRQGRPEK